MTRNRRAKQDARTRQSATGEKYTTARRATSQSATDRGEVATRVTAMTQRLHDDLGWADLVLDGRREHDRLWSAPVAEFPPARGPSSRLGRGSCGDPEPIGGKFTVPSLDQHLPGEVLVEGCAVDAVPHVKPGMVLRVTYPDGWRLGYLSWHFAGYHASAEAVWAGYLRHPLDGIGAGFATTTPKDLSRLQRQVGTAVQSLRRAVADLPGWFGPDGPADSDPGGNPVNDLWRDASCGFHSAPDADAVLNWLDPVEVLTAQATGCDLSQFEHRHWLCEFGRDWFDGFEYLPPWAESVQAFSPPPIGCHLDGDNSSEVGADR